MEITRVSVYSSVRLILLYFSFVFRISHSFLPLTVLSEYIGHGPYLYASPPSHIASRETRWSTHVQVRYFA